MIPVERVTELLRLHPFDPSSSLRDCLCDWQEGDDYHGSHASHVAGVLADAGLIPTQREWGVRDERNGGIYVDTFSSRQSAERYMTEYKSPEIVTRWTGATEWESA